MKKLFLLVTISIVLNAKLNAQQVLTVQNGSSTKVYNKFDSAFVNAQNGDTIYIPGGNFNLGSQFYISKRICLVGVGHNPDSSQATAITYISANLYFLDGSSGSTLTGLYISGSIYLTNGFNSFPPAPGIDNISISRCNIGGINGNYSASGQCCACISNPEADNFLITENVIRGGIGGINGNANVFSNNIIEGTIMGVGQNTFKNNIFLLQGSCPYYCSNPISGVQNAIIENNIFITTNLTIGDYTYCGGHPFIVYSSNNTFTKNLFVESITAPYCSNCQEYNNYIGVNAGTIFTNQTGNTFNYSQNYHLKTPSLYQGTDGTQVGIYGGTFPWKEGSIPFNPHISSKNIDPQNDANGNIRIRIKVKAQSN